jgi:hypothetical protein
MASRSLAQAGHNSRALSEEEKDALATKFALDIIRDEKVVALKKADLDGARSKVNGHFKLVSKELGITRKDFEANVISVMGLTEAEYLAAEQKRIRLHQMAGAKPLGAQLDLEDRINDTVDDAIAAEADGYRSGRRADDPEPPAHIAGMFVTDWMRGWTRGQEVNAKAEAMAADILARPAVGELAEGENPDDEADEDAEIEDSVDALKASGWAAPTSDEEAFEEADNGRTIRQPRGKAREAALN